MINERFLYRAKNSDTWVNGFLFQLYYTGGFSWCIGNEPLSPNDYSELSGEGQDWFIADPSTICQATGLHDATRWEELTCEEQRQFLNSDNVRENRKNQESDWQGKLIFEGDILAAYLDDKNPDDVTYSRIVWDRNAWCIQEAGSFDLHLLDEDVEEDYKIVGNVFDNPELVELLEEEA